MQGPSQWGLYLLPPSVYASRKLDFGEFKLQHISVRIHDFQRVLATRPNVCTVIAEFSTN